MRVLIRGSVAVSNKNNILTPASVRPSAVFVKILKVFFQNHVSVSTALSIGGVVFYVHETTQMHNVDKRWRCYHLH